MLQRKSYLSCASLMYRGRKSGRKGELWKERREERNLNILYLWQSYYNNTARFDYIGRG